MSEELKCSSCQQKDKEIEGLKVELDNLRHFCDSIFDMAKRNNGVLYFKKDCGTWKIETGKEQTIFDHITESEEVLAEKFVIKQCNSFGGSSYKAILLVDENGNYRDFYSREKAVAATIEELKKEYKENDTE